jgi:hypothetical protein
MKFLSARFLSLILLISESFSQLKKQEAIQVYSEDYFDITCDSHFYYLTMDISIVNKEVKSLIPFELTLLSPQDLKFKCLIDSSQQKFNCFSFVPLGLHYRKEELFFHLFYYPPKIPGIQFDSDSFIRHSRKWENTTECGSDNYLLNATKVDYNYWNQFSIVNLYGGECQSFYEDKEQKNVYYFNMKISLEDKKIIKDFEENKDMKIEFIQDIKVLLYLKYKRYDSTLSINSREYAYCKANNLMDINVVLKNFLKRRVNLQVWENYILQVKIQQRK